jgi:hypothetical protein
MKILNIIIRISSPCILLFCLYKVYLLTSPIDKFIGLGLTALVASGLFSAIKYI